jgi:hypothetical protein
MIQETLTYNTGNGNPPYCEETVTYTPLLYPFSFSFYRIVSWRGVRLRQKKEKVQVFMTSREVVENYIFAF